MACPTPDKRKFFSREEAKEAAEKNKYENVHVYQCEGCTAWHITKLEPGKYIARKTYLKYKEKFKKLLK